MFGYSRIAVKRALTASMAATTMVIGVTPSGLGAQDLPPVPIVGDRVRVALPDATVIGEVTGVSPEGFDIDIEGDGYRSVIHSEIEQLELRHRIAMVLTACPLLTVEPPYGGPCVLRMNRSNMLR